MYKVSLQDALGARLISTLTIATLAVLVTGFLGNVASYVFSNAAGVGASGAVFGILGALVAYNLRRRRSALAQAQLRWATMLLVINALLAIGIRQIDWHAHLGGFVAGVVLGGILDSWGTRAVRIPLQIAGTVALVAVGVVLAATHTPVIVF